MTIARSKQVNPEEPAWYHTISRCVRRARLCGFDPETGESFEHRKYWIRNRLADLERVFAADVATYGIMDNHLHLVVHRRSWDNPPEESSTGIRDRPALTSAYQPFGLVSPRSQRYQDLEVHKPRGSRPSAFASRQARRYARASVLRPARPCDDQPHTRKRPGY